METDFFSVCDHIPKADHHTWEPIAVVAGIPETDEALLLEAYLQNSHFVIYRIT